MTVTIIQRSEEPSVSGYWWPLCEMLNDGEQSVLLVESKDGYTATSTRLSELLKANEFSVEEPGVVFVDSVERLEKVLSEAGWVKQFIAFGP